MACRCRKSCKCPKGGGAKGWMAAGAVVAGIVMANGAHSGHHAAGSRASLADTVTAPMTGGQHAIVGHHHRAARPRPAAPAAGGTREAWAQDVLRAAGLPVTDDNVRAIVTWTISEGGGWGNQAANNPLNLNPGSAPWPGHAVDGAWAFPTWEDGVLETAAYLRMSNYVHIRAALERGNSVHAVIAAIVESPWAGSHYATNQVMQDALRDS